MCKKKKPRVSTKKETVMYRINHADIKKWAAEYKGELFDAVLCDPPYEISFMQKSWDGSGIAHDVEMWTDLLRILKPGGHLLAFSGSRTYHRMAVAIEDAGFEIRDMIEWLYGSGFPKSLNIGKAVDRIQGNEREVVGTQTLGGNATQTTKEKGGTYASNTNAVGVKPINVEITKGTSEWEGYGTALKPSHEPCVLARKPLDKGMTVANNVLKHGTGGLNIDGSRIGTEQMTNHGGGVNTDGRKYGNGSGIPAIEKGATVATGRFPANLLVSDDVLNTHSKYFDLDAWADTLPFLAVPKASKSEKNKGLDGFIEKQAGGMSGTHDKSLKTGSGNERNNMAKNHHPTVKPLKLMSYLITLGSRPGDTVLDPFVGSGTTVVAAKQLDRKGIGIEREPEYAEIAQARVDAAKERLRQEVLL